MGTKTLRIPPTTCRSSNLPQNYHPDIMCEFPLIYTQARTLGTCKSFQPNSNDGISPSVPLCSQPCVESNHSCGSKAHSLITLDLKSCPVIYPCESIGLLRLQMTSPPQGRTRPHVASEFAYNLIPAKSQIGAQSEFPIKHVAYDITSHA